jgi:hypothetical protein
MDALTESRALIVANRAMLAVTRHRIAASRRSLNPFFGVSGGADARLNEIARALLGCGSLAPIRGNVTWAGHGSGGTCCVCGEAVTGSEIEYEIEDGERRSLGCHFLCFIAWQEESRRERAIG